MGYVACSIFLNEKDEFLRLVINSVRNDLISRNEAYQCLALDFIANGGCMHAQPMSQLPRHHAPMTPGQPPRS